MAAGINTGDRLCFTLFLALAFHATLILGVSFDLWRNANPNPVIEVTLAQTPSDQAPEQADFLAQANQVGGGELKEKALPSMTQPTEYIAQEVREVSPESPAPAQPDTDQPLQAVVTTTQSSTLEASAENQALVPEKRIEWVSEEISLLERSLQLASVDARLDAREQFNTRQDRVHQIHSVSALSASDAYYVKQWISKIHRIGKLNYPEEARRRKIYGSLRLTVSLLPNGSVKDIRILDSSGNKILDDAAIRIVRLAEPFAPFPAELARDYDSLEITRTWVFSKDGSSPLL